MVSSTSGEGNRVRATPSNMIQTFQPSSKARSRSARDSWKPMQMYSIAVTVIGHYIRTMSFGTPAQSRIQRKPILTHALMVGEFRPIRNWMRCQIITRNGHRMKTGMDIGSVADTHIKTLLLRYSSLLPAIAATTMAVPAIEATTAYIGVQSLAAATRTPCSSAVVT